MENDVFQVIEEDEAITTYSYNYFYFKYIQIDEDKSVISVHFNAGNRLVSSFVNAILIAG